MVLMSALIVSWSRKAIDKLRNCQNYEMSGKIPVCKGMDNFSSVMLDNPAPGTGRMFDNGLFLTFVVGFISFLVASFYMIITQDFKSLQIIRNRVARTTDTIVTLLRALWILKICKRANLALEEELIKKNRHEAEMKTTHYYEPFDVTEGHESTDQESKYPEPTEFVEQNEFSLNDEWSPLKDEENSTSLNETSADVPHNINLNNQNHSDGSTVPRAKKSEQSSPRLPKSKSDSQSKYASVQVLYERKSVVRDSSGNRSKNRDNIVNRTTTSHTSPDFPSTTQQQSRISHMSYFPKKSKNYASQSDSTPRGIFSQRRKTKNMDQISKIAVWKTPSAKFRSRPVENSY